MPLRVLYVDFNSYFASVEQHLCPALRGKPIGILPVLAETTCCIAASYEAKRHGVKTGTLVAEARKLCPYIQFVMARPALYVEFHHRLVEAVESCTHVEHVYSIDEMACLLTGSQQDRVRALALAAGIKHTVADRVGASLTCSIGIAPNTFLAKTASDMQKPDGCVVLEEKDLPHSLYSLKLRDLCGIGKATERRLVAHDIKTVQDLCEASRETLREAWGSIEGERMHACLRGELTPEREYCRSSVSHSHVLPPELRNHQDAYSVLHRLLQKAAMRLRSLGLATGAIQVAVKFTNHPRWHKNLEFPTTTDTVELLHAFDLLWKSYPMRTHNVPLHVSVALYKLDEMAHRTGSLFGNDLGRDRLNSVIDALNLRYGKNTLYFGGAHATLAAAPMRIAFNHIPDLMVERDDNDPA
jgi:DNA polymerase-4